MDDDQKLHAPQAPVHRDVERAVLRALQGIRFGSLEIIIHDSKVVRIERKEKIRLDLQDPSGKEVTE